MANRESHEHLEAAQSSIADAMRSWAAERDALQDRLREQTARVESLQAARNELAAKLLELIGVES